MKQPKDQIELVIKPAEDPAEWIVVVKSNVQDGKLRAWRRQVSTITIAASFGFGVVEEEIASWKRRHGLV